MEAESSAGAIKDLSEAKVREYLASKAVSAEVKAALQKEMLLQSRIAETKKELAEAEKQLKAVSDDQARSAREPARHPAVGRAVQAFLDKFVTQENEIDTLQRQIRQVTATLQAQEREQVAFLANLNVD